MILILYTLLATAMFYLGSRAKITAWLWSRYPPALARFMDCAACTGFWWGVIWHVSLGRTYGLDVGPLPALALETHVLVGLCVLVLTPIAAGVMQYGLELVGSAVDDADD